MSGMFEAHLGGGNAMAATAIMMMGLYIVMSRAHLIKKILGLNLFQNGVFLFYISLGKVSGGTAPILTGEAESVYSNPLPHVLILTAIVVGVATMAVGLALAARIHDAYGTVEEGRIALMDMEEDEGEKEEGEAETMERGKDARP